MTTDATAPLPARAATAERVDDPDYRKLMGLMPGRPLYAVDGIVVDQYADGQWFVNVGQVGGGTMRRIDDGALLDMAYRILGRLHPAGAQAAAGVALEETIHAAAEVAALGVSTVDDVLADLRAAGTPAVDHGDPVQAEAASAYVLELRTEAAIAETGGDADRAVLLTSRADALEAWLDPLRVHLASEHGNGYALDRTHEEAVTVHDFDHSVPDAGHEPGDLAYDMKSALEAYVEHLAGQ